MSRWRPETLLIGLDDSTVAGVAGESAPVARGDGGVAWDAVLLAQAMRGQMRPGTRYTAVHVSVAGDLCRHFMQPTPAGLRSLSELSRLAAVRAGQLFGGATDGWTIAADWQLSAPSVCAAVPTGLVQALHAAAATLALSLRVESAVLTALERVAPATAPDGGLAWRTPVGTALAQRGDRGIVNVRWSRTGADLLDAEWAQQAGRELMQESMRSAIPFTTLWMASPLALRVDDLGLGIGNRALPVKAVPAAFMLPSVQGVPSEAAWAYRVAREILGQGRTP